MLGMEEHIQQYERVTISKTKNMVNFIGHNDLAPSTNKSQGFKKKKKD